MEFFNKAKAVKLKSHSNRYLIADDDQISTRLSRNGAARKARWLVELVESNSHVIRLKSCYNRYLTASSHHFLRGVTGRKVLQTMPENHTKDLTIEWQPIRDGFQVKLRAVIGGTYLRANGGAPPWRNSVTHDSSCAGATHDWVMWGVEAVVVPEDEATEDYLSRVSKFSSFSDEMSGLEFGFESSIPARSRLSALMSSRFSMMKKLSSKFTFRRSTAMDLFLTAKTVRLKSSHDKYLTADEDEESVIQDRNGSSKSAKWTVEFVENSDNIIRLKGCYNKYLTASNQPFLLGMTGQKVIQSLPSRLDSSVEWEPIRENCGVRLKTRYGQFLRANGGLPPWRNSVTHDIPHRTSTQEWISWDVHVVEILVAQSPAGKAPPPMVARKEDSSTSESSSLTTSNSPSFSRQESSDSFVGSVPKGNEGRLIYFYIADGYGEVDQGFEELCISFKGNGVHELTMRLEVELGVEGITVCTRSPLNGKLCPLHLQLPPNNTTMHVIVVPPSSRVSQDLDKTGVPFYNKTGVPFYRRNSEISPILLE